MDVSRSQDSGPVHIQNRKTKNLNIKQCICQQRMNGILYNKFPEIFLGIVPEKYRYFLVKIPQEISEHPTLDLVLSTVLLCSVLDLFRPYITYIMLVS